MELKGLPPAAAVSSIFDFAGFDTLLIVPKKITTKLFIERAKEKHGRKYRYDKTVYVKAHDHVIITCPKPGHGDFPCTPSNHLNKNHPRGCPICGGSAKLTWGEFVERSKEANPGIWKYPKQRIVNVKTPVNLICVKRGHHISQTPDSNLMGHGCWKCRDIEHGLKSLVSESEINERLKKICNQKGDSRVSIVKGAYEGMNKRAPVVCSVHGIQPPRHMTTVLNSVHPCIECAQIERSGGYNSQQFLQVVKEHFGDKYEIKPFVFVGRQTALELYCSDHEMWFGLQAGSVLKSRGCPKCARITSKENRRKGILAAAEKSRSRRYQEWLKQVQGVHRDKYDYSNVIYKDQHTRVSIKCPNHGPFWQTPADHKAGGCIECAIDELKGRYTKQYFNKNPEEKEIPAFLYYLKFEFGSDHFFKIGITKATIKSRFSAATAMGLSYEILGIKETTLFSAFSLEQELQKIHGDLSREISAFTKFDTRDSRIGPTECFTEELPKRLFNKYFH